jgi:hypothetical protein
MGFNPAMADSTGHQRNPRLLAAAGHLDPSLPGQRF